MNDIKRESMQLASLAVFRELYDSEKDVYGVICAFLGDIIISNAKYRFSLPEITNLLNRTFSFSIPEAIVATSLRRLNVEKENSFYTVNDITMIGNFKVTTLQEEIGTSNDIIIEDLFSFVESVKNIELTKRKKEKIVHSFCAFLLDESNGGEYYEYISGFAIQNKHDTEFRKKVNKIREGVILYSGLTYNSNLNEIGSWRKKLTIYLDTEILFHFAGYNGKVHESLFNDFFKYVKEINSNAKKKLVHLKYFSEIKNEIDGFFTKARHIVRKQDKRHIETTAMYSVLEGCKVPSDVMDKKSDFYLYLKNNGIHEDKSTNYFEKSNHKYNIFGQDTIEIISDELNFDATEHLNFLNYVSIHRKEEKSRDFYDIGHIFLTGNSKTIKVALHNQIRARHTVPLATRLNWITNRFWFKLNKGFGDGNFPLSFDIITKSQIILSSVLNKSVSKKYEDLQTQFKKNEVTEEQVKARIIQLRSQGRKPEEIESNDIPSILDAISEDSLEQFVRAEELFKSDALEKAEENSELKRTLSIAEKAFKDEEIAKNTAQTDLIRLSVEHEMRTLTEKKETIRVLENQKQPIDTRAKQKFNNFRLTIGISYILFLLFIFYLIIKYDWNSMEPWTFILGIIFASAVPFFYLLIFGRSWNPKHFLERKKEHFKQQEYMQSNFDINYLLKLKKDVTQLEKNIENEKKTH